MLPLTFYTAIFNEMASGAIFQLDVIVRCNSAGSTTFVIEIIASASELISTK
jgi:hypothetical protein